MASFVLGTMGSLLGPVGGIVGGLVGGFIDQALFAKAQDPIEGPRLSELRVPSFEEGGPVPLFYGPEARVPGQVIWMGPLVEQPVNQNGGGGKGGGSSSPTVVNYEYFVDIAIAFARHEMDSLTPIKKVYANGTLIYELEPSYDQTSSVVAVTKQTINKTVGNCTNKSWREEIIFDHDGTGVANFFDRPGYQMVPGFEVEVSGCTDAVNNGTWTVLSVQKDFPTVNKSRMVVTRCYHDWREQGWWGNCSDASSCVAGATRVAGDAIRFQQTTGDFNSAQVTDANQYNGSETQGVDPIIEAVEDAAGNDIVPAFRGTTYIVLKQLNVTKWGSSVPGFEAVVQEDADGYLDTTVGKVLESSGAFTSDDYDTSDLSSTQIKGVAQTGIKPPLDLLTSLFVAYDLAVQQRGVIEDGVFKNKLFVYRKREAEKRSIADGDRGAREVGSSDTSLVHLTKRHEEPVPNFVNLSYMDSEQSSEPRAVNVTRDGATIFNQTRVTLPMALTKEEAFDIANKLLWEQELASGLEVKVTLPMYYIDVIEGDVLVVNDLDGRTLYVRVTEVDRGANGLIEVSGLHEFQRMYAQ